MNQRHGWRQNNRRRRSFMNKEEREIYEKYALKAFRKQLHYGEEQMKLYSEGWEDATQYIIEVMVVRQFQMMSNMSDDEFNQFMRNQLGGDK